MACFPHDQAPTAQVVEQLGQKEKNQQGHGHAGAQRMECTPGFFFFPNETHLDDQVLSEIAINDLYGQVKQHLEHTVVAKCALILTDDNLLQMISMTIYCK